MNESNKAEAALTVALELNKTGQCTQKGKNNTNTPNTINVKYIEHAYKNKKSELMLMRRTRTYSSSCLQVILVYFHPFHRNSLSPKITKNPFI